MDESDVMNVCKRSVENVENAVDLSVTLINKLNEAILSHFNETPLKTNYVFNQFVLMTSKLQQV